MKVFKFILLLLIVFFLLASAAVVFFLMQFDPDQFRPQLEHYLSDNVGADVKLGPISMAWGMQMGFRIGGLEMRDAGRSRLLLKTGALNANLALRPLLSRQLVIDSFHLNKPEIFVVREQSGEWNWQIAGPKKKEEAAKPAEKKSPPAAAAPVAAVVGPAEAWKFVISEIQVSGGTLHFSEESLRPPFAVTVRSLEAKAKQSGADAPLLILAHGAAFESPEPNLFLDAAYHLLNPSVIFKFSYGRDVMVLEGDVTSLTANPRFQGKLKVHQWDLESALPDEWKSGEYLSGTVTATLQGSGAGTHPEALKQTLAMEGAVDIRDGAFKNLNIVNAVLARLTPVPGLQNVLLNQMPPELDPVLKGQDTPFELLQANFQIEQGRVNVTEAKLKHSHYAVEGEGALGIVQPSVDFRARLILMDQITGFLTQSVRELAYLQSEEGRITIPFFYRGFLPHASVQPDLGYITTVVFRRQGERLIGEGLERLSEFLGQKGEAQTQAQDPAQALPQDPTQGQTP